MADSTPRIKDTDGILVSQKEFDENRRFNMSPLAKSKALEVSSVDLEKVQDRLFTILERDVNHLMLKSHTKKLSRDEGALLVSYLKMLKELKNIDATDDTSYSDEELEKIANGKE